MFPATAIGRECGAGFFVDVASVSLGVGFGGRLSNRKSTIRSQRDFRLKREQNLGVLAVDQPLPAGSTSLYFLPAGSKYMFFFAFELFNYSVNETAICEW